MSDPAVVNGRDHAIIGHTLSFSLNVPNLQVLQIEEVERY